MNVAVIIASGVGKRMGQDIPKQFLSIDNKPILIYTLQAFQAHPEIDAIEVVCLEGWEEFLKSYSSQYGITKLKWICNGGKLVQESIFKGLENIKNDINKDDIVIIHDGIRPIVDFNVISDCIKVCKKYGNGVTATPYLEQMFIADDDISTLEYIPRDKLRKVSTPQAYKFNIVYKAYIEAFEKDIGIKGSSYTNTMMVELGHRLYFSKGSEKNVKITTTDDLEIFQALLKNTRMDWLK